MILPLFSKSISSLSDEELMSRISRNSDEKAFDELYHRHARRVMGFLFRQMNGNESLAADMLQDAFMKIWYSRESFSGNSFRTWIYSIAYNLCKNHYRHVSYERDYKAEIQASSEEAHEEEMAILMDRTAFDEALQKEVSGMRPPDRMLFSLRYEEELTIPQIASVLDIPEGTVKSRLYSITNSLKRKFQHYGRF